MDDQDQPQYRVDEKLNIIVDKRVRTELGKSRLENLEKQKQLFWRDSVAEKMEKTLQHLEIELKALSEEMEGVEIKHNLLKLKVLTYPVGKEMIIVLDSLDIVNLVDWDSLEGGTVKEIREIEFRHGAGVIAKPAPRPE